eukprot:927417-Amphidinium_carterae.2
MHICTPPQLAAALLFPTNCRGKLGASAGFQDDGVTLQHSRKKFLMMVSAHAFQLVLHRFADPELPVVRKMVACAGAPVVPLAERNLGNVEYPEGREVCKGT